MTAVAVGLSRDLGRGRVMRAELDGHDLAIWRGNDDVLRAWNNRCPHRGMRLSHGFVRGNRLACLYHGWQYGPDGACAYIPAHPDLDPPDTIRPKSYAVAEIHGLIWVSTEGAGALPEPAANAAPLRSMSFACDAAAVETAMRTTPWHGVRPSLQAPRKLALKDALLLYNLTQVHRTKTMVHVRVASQTEGDLDPATLKSLSRWCEAARTHAESASA